MQAERHNANKPALSMFLEARNALAGAAKVMEFGAAKYSRSNWRKGFPHTALADSLLRHLTAWLAGEDIDPESGQSHLDHVLVNAMFLSETAKTFPNLDDREVKAPEWVPSFAGDLPPLGARVASNAANYEALAQLHHDEAEAPNPLNTADTVGPSEG